jgi:hypothetical protein
MVFERLGNEVLDVLLQLEIGIWRSFTNGSLNHGDLLRPVRPLENFRMIAAFARSFLSYRLSAMERLSPRPRALLYALSGLGSSGPKP